MYGSQLSTGCEYMECIIANRVTRPSLTFNLLAVSSPQANGCLFKPPQPRRSAVETAPDFLTNE